MSDDLQNRLSTILERQARICAGTVQLLGLESLRDRLGPRWPAVRDRVHQLTERLLKQSLDPADIVFPYGTDTYLVVFARLDERAASLLCARILQDLQRLLLGDADAATIVVRTAVRQVSGDLVVRPHRLSDMMADAAADDAAGESDAKPEGADHQGTAGAPPGGRAASLTGAGGTPGEPGWVPLAAQGGGTFRQDDVTAAWAARGQLGPLEIVYRPVWDAIHQSVSLYVARGRRVRRGGQAVYGYDTIPQTAAGSLSAENLAAILELDEETVRQAIAVYLDLYDSRFRFYLSLPVHYETLAAMRRRRSYLALASRIPAHLVPFLSYHLVGLPAGTPTGRLADFVTALRPVGRGVTVEVRLGRQDMGILEAAGVKGVGVVLPGVDDPLALPTALDGPGTERPLADRVATDLGLVAAEAQRRRLKLYVEGVHTVEAEALIDRVGADFVAGDLIGGWTMTPRHIARLTRVELLANSRQSSGA
ncbi:hypothetical protein [Nitrospirillum sp. BR 11828]|uniref:hypothetical protein n=1 Tax=Nitrospirillum sp. BR 11828 TaxID=3104325 RepID=UPI002ACA932C|nr:hypothetical protein [Nitrospirillum sp. BR 11828]MDZ5649075.1 hypothetical protein [Nitrospirillum sp. BR 11828]